MTQLTSVDQARKPSLAGAGVVLNQAPQPRPDPSLLGISRRTALGIGALGFTLGALIHPFQKRRRPLLACIPAGSCQPGKGGSGDVLPGEVRILALGDLGLATPTRDLVVAEMSAYMVGRPAEAVFLLGDNFYPNGVTSVEDEQWRSKFEQLFPEATFPIPFQACLGNHDHEGSVAAQVEYSRRSSRWSMPAQYYSRILDLQDGAKAEFFVLDTQRLWKDHTDDSPQLRWFEDALARSKARWKIAVGHHCIRSGGAHGERGILAEIAGRLEPRFERHGVDLYLSGHDHDLQLLRTTAGWLQVVSGAGSVLRDSGLTDDTLFADSAPGFVALVLRAEELRIEFHIATLGLVHAHTLHAARSLEALREG